ncbi:MAG: hypothetical protein EPO25_01830 [Gammaproteobacteria bacterium]|nr:MAG: hypothetical protein EPO25_01830 [Gammaproteobacteria bacterium]
MRRAGWWPACVAGVVMTVVAGSAAAGGSFQAELGTDPVQLAGRVKLSLMNGDGDGAESGRGPVPYLKALGAPPRRVALISYYVYDCGNHKEKSYRFYGGDYVYRVNTRRARKVDSDDIGRLATELHDAGIGPLREAFATVGMQLLAPEEFLDAPEKQAAYQNTKIEAGGMAGLFNALQSKEATHWQWGTADGYRLIKLTTVGNVRGNDFALATSGIGVGKLAASVGYDLATALGVDAVAILYNVVQAEKTSIRLRGAYLYLFGPNPVADSGQSLYWKGHQYSGVYLRTDVDFVETDKDGDLVAADYAGYGVVAGALGTRIAQHIKGKTG